MTATAALARKPEALSRTRNRWVIVRLDAVISGFDEHARIRDGIVRQDIVCQRFAESGRDIERFLVRRKRDAVREISRPVAVTAEERHFPVFDQIETVLGKLALRAIGAPPRRPFTLSVK